MSITRFLASAVNSLAAVPPPRLAAGLSGAAGFFMAFVLLPSTNSDAPAGNQQIIVWFGALITAVLTSQLAAYVQRIVEQRPFWPDLSPVQKVAVTLILALVSAALVLALVLLVS